MDTYWGYDGNVREYVGGFLQLKGLQLDIMVGSGCFYRVTYLRLLCHKLLFLHGYIIYFYGVRDSMKELC